MKERAQRKQLIRGFYPPHKYKDIGHFHPNEFLASRVVHRLRTDTTIVHLLICRPILRRFSISRIWWGLLILGKFSFLPNKWFDTWTSEPYRFSKSAQTSLMVGRAETMPAIAKSRLISFGLPWVFAFRICSLSDWDASIYIILLVIVSRQDPK